MWSASRETRRAHGMRISVRDTGPGIPADKVDSVFDKFSQVDGSTTRKYGGTGLGLAISKQLVDLMGGSIGVTSQLGEGSTFSFTLPLELDAHPHAAPIPFDELRSLRALIVDDNEVNRRVLRRANHQLGHAQHEFCDGSEEALRGAPGSCRPPGIRIISRCSITRCRAWTARNWRASSKPIRQLRETVVVLLSSVSRRLETGQKRERCDRRVPGQTGEAVAVVGYPLDGMGQKAPGIGPRSREGGSSGRRDACRPGGSLRRHAGTRAGGGRQYREPEGGHAHARKARDPPGPGGERAGGGGDVRHSALPPDPHGLPDAGDGWLRRRARDPP